MVLPHLTRRDLELLYLLVELISCSSYRLSKMTGIPSASTWRTLLRLKVLGLVDKESNVFRITTRGLVLCYYMAEKLYIKEKVLDRLKEWWNYDGDKADLKSFLDDLESVMKSNGISPFDLCYKEPISLALLMIARSNGLKNLSEATKKVIGRLFLKFFPHVTLPSGCRALVSYDSEGKVYGLAVDCRISGTKIFHRCPELEKEVEKLNKGR